MIKKVKLLIQELVREKPKNVEEFLEWVRSRLHYKNVSYLSKSDQDELVINV